jgi:hypothetical protein
MKAQHSTTNRSVELAPSITTGFTRKGDPAEVCIAIAFGYKPLMEEMDLRESHGMRAVMALGLYAGYMTQDVMTKAQYRQIERAARGFRKDSENPVNQRLASFVLRQALRRALQDGVVGKRSHRTFTDIFLARDNGSADAGPQVDFPTDHPSVLNRN